MRPMARLVMVSVIAITAVAVLSPMVAPDGQRCSTCHSGSNPSGGYEFRMPTVESAYPGVVPPNTTFSYSLELRHPGDFTVKGLEVTASVQGEGRLASPEGASRQMPSIPPSGGTSTASWAITTGNATGTLSIGTAIRFTAHFRHTNNDDNDDGSYLLAHYSTITVRPVAIYATDTDIVLTASSGQAASFELVSFSPARNISLAASPVLAPVLSFDPHSVGRLDPGQRQGVRLNIVNGSTPVENGRINILWENETGALDSSFVIVNVRMPGPGPAPLASSTLVLTGRVTGLLSLGLLVASLALGFVKKGGQRRIRVHCAVSWFILALSVYHGIMLVWGPFSRVWLGNWILLGYISAAIMGASSVNGLARKWMSKRFGHKAWIWVHRITIVIAIVLVIVHAVLMGTDFALLRNLLQPDAGASMIAGVDIPVCCSS